MKRSAPLRRHKPMKHGAADAEYKLWSMLRGRQFAGLSFRKREPIGPYIAAFCCPAAKVIVELGPDADETRLEWFRLHGYRVLQFANEGVLRNPERVMDSIAEAFRMQPVRLSGYAGPDTGPSSG